MERRLTKQAQTMKQVTYRLPTGLEAQLVQLAQAQGEAINTTVIRLLTRAVRQEQRRAQRTTAQ